MGLLNASWRSQHCLHGNHLSIAAILIPLQGTLIGGRIIGGIAIGLVIVILTMLCPDNATPVQSSIYDRPALPGVFSPMSWVGN